MMVVFMTEQGTQIQPDIHAEAQRLLAAIERRDLDARLIGGMAIRLLAGARLHPAFERSIHDLDFILAKRHRRDFDALLTGAGYVADQEFNALNGARRLLYDDHAYGRQVDVFVEAFSMCHVLPLADRIADRPRTLPAAELLMTKLQIVELNAKDRGDLYALLHSHDVGAHGAEAIELARIVELTANDWGLQHTFELNLTRLRDALADQPLRPEEASAIASRIEAIAEAMERAPKSRRWKLRARVGERKRWYEQPEEVER
jgi:hypothetical protein